MGSFRLAVPPSLGGGKAEPVARTLAAVLQRAGLSVDVFVARDYQAIIQGLEKREIGAAWGPPVVCAWAEAFGGHGLVRSVRQGHGTYRAALVARKGESISLTQPGLRAAWVDRDSMAGYVLAQALLRERGLRPSRHFAQTEFLGSYRAALEAVLDKKADLTSVRASPAAVSPATHGAAEFVGARGAELEVVAYTQECPSDGVVAGPAMDKADQDALQKALMGLDAKTLKEVFAAERFEVPPAGAYRKLHETVFKALAG